MKTIRATRKMKEPTSSKIKGTLVSLYLHHEVVETAAAIKSDRNRALASRYSQGSIKSTSKERTSCGHRVYQIQ